MEEDISKKTIAVLLTITVVLSVVGTWLMVTSTPEAIIQGPMDVSPNSGGQVSFAILESEPSTSGATGLIAFEIQ